MQLHFCSTDTCLFAKQLDAMIHVSSQIECRDYWMSDCCCWILSIFQSMDRDAFLASIILLLIVLTIELATKTMSFHYFFSKSNLTDLKVVPVLECCGLSVLHLKDLRLQSDNFWSLTI